MMSKSGISLISRQWRVFYGDKKHCWMIGQPWFGSLTNTSAFDYSIAGLPGSAEQDAAILYLLLE